MGDPDPAFLVGTNGYPAKFSDAAYAEPHTWAVSSLVPAGQFVDYLLNYEPPDAGVMVASSHIGAAALVLWLQLDRWQHRIVIPLIGRTIHAYLSALKARGQPARVELSAKGLTQAQGFDVQIGDALLAKALAVHVQEAGPEKDTAHRRAMGMHCLGMRSPRAVPPHPSAKDIRAITVGRVWPPELPMLVIGDESK